MKALIAVGVVAAGATLWYTKFASPADRSNTQCLVEMLTGYRMPGHYLRG